VGNTALLRLLRGCSYNLEQSRGIFIQHIECREKYGLNLARERIVKGTATHLLHMQLTQCLTPLCIALSLSLSHSLTHRVHHVPGTIQTNIAAAKKRTAATAATATTQQFFVQFFLQFFFQWFFSPHTTTAAHRPAFGQRYLCHGGKNGDEPMFLHLGADRSDSWFGIAREERHSGVQQTGFHEKRRCDTNIKQPLSSLH
jgi:hypothetical protein